MISNFSYILSRFDRRIIIRIITQWFISVVEILLSLRGTTWRSQCPIPDTDVPWRGGHGSHLKGGGSEIIKEGCRLGIQGIKECVSHSSCIFDPDCFPIVSISFNSLFSTFEEGRVAWREQAKIRDRLKNRSDFVVQFLVELTVVCTVFSLMNCRVAYLP